MKIPSFLATSCALILAASAGCRGPSSDDEGGGLLRGAVLANPAESLGTPDVIITARHIHKIEKGARVEGSVRQLGDKHLDVKDAIITFDVVVPGTPDVTVDKSATYAGTIDGAGPTDPAHYRVRLGAKASVRHVVRRTAPVELTPVAAPPRPSTRRDAHLHDAGDSPGDFATLRDLHLTGAAGPLAVPPGAYGHFDVSKQGRLILGVAGSSERAVYHLQRLDLKDDSRVLVTGPVTLVIARDLKIEHDSQLGDEQHACQLKVDVADGHVEIKHRSALHGFLNAPSSKVKLEHDSRLVGRVWADEIDMHEGGLVRGAPLDEPVLERAPSATIGAAGTSATLLALASDCGGEALLTYSWTVAGDPPAPVAFGANGTHDASQTTSIFTRAGTYDFIVTVANPAGRSTQGTVRVVVEQAIASLIVLPAQASIVPGRTALFSAVARDQFGDLLLPQPAVSWSVSGGGAIDSAGLFTAGAIAGTFTITARAGAAGAERVATASVVIADSPPEVARPAAAMPPVVSGDQTALSALGGDDAGEAGLVYSWSASGPSPVTFTPNGDNAAKDTTATFTGAGDYTIAVTITDEQGQTTTSTVAVTVSQTLSSVAVTPAVAVLNLNQQRVFAALASDQFGDPLAMQPPIAWSASGGGSIAQDGRFTAGTIAGGPHTVQASSGVVTGTAELNIVDAAPTVAQPASAIPAPVTQAATAVAVLGADDGGEANLIYSWSAQGPAAVTFAPNASHAARDATATFARAGDYVLTATISDAGGGSTTSSVSVTVAQTITTITVSPMAAQLNLNGEQRFLASGADQFGDVMAPQPAFAFSTTGGGTIDGAGLYRAGTVAGGPHTIRALAGAVTGSALLTIVDAPPSVVMPATAAANPVLGTSVALGALGTDDNGPSTLTYAWTAQGPAPVVFAPNNVNAASSTIATFQRAGDYQLSVAIVDSDGQSTPSVVNVSVTQTLTSVDGAPDASVITQDRNLQASAIARDQFSDGIGAAVVYAWSQIAGPGVATFSDAALANPTVSFSATGAYTLRVTATAGGVSVIDQILVTVDPAAPQNTAPVVNAGANQAVTMPTAATLGGSVTDDGRPNGTLTIQWSRVSGPGVVTFANAAQASTTATFSQPGTYVLRLTGDDSALDTSSDVTVTVAPPLGPLPTVAITAPATGANIATLATVSGTVSGGAWRLEHRLDADDSVSTSPYIEFASGVGAINNAPLGTFDPTLLLNGTYRIRLTATTNAGSASTSIVVSAIGEQKVGHFTISLVDLSVPVAGLPIQVIRTYDSRDKRAGDFGVGWTVSVKSARVEKSGVAGENWQQTRSGGFLPNYCLVASRPSYVTVTFPSNRTYKFQAATTPSCQQVFPIEFGDLSYTAVAPTLGSLVPLDASGFFFTGGAPGPGELLDDGTFDLINPELFQLTTEDGNQYVISQRDGVQSVTDRNGNRLTIGAGGIVHTSGKSVTFTRDGQGRITRITDPAGNARLYNYSPANDLASSTDREGNTTTYTYNSSHGLVDLRDPRGVRAVRNDYDASGRLISRTDASGNVIHYNHDVVGRREEVTDRLGNLSVLEYDPRGNVLRETLPDGTVVNRTFDARDNQLSEVDALGKTTSYTYDARDNRTREENPLGHATARTYSATNDQLTETDALGRVMTFAYDARGNRTSVTTGDGRTTTYTYDAAGNILSETDPLGCITRFEYNGAGHVTRQIDALGTATTYTYDANGNRLSQATSRTTPMGLEALVTTYEYDADDHRVRTTSPDGSTELTAWNSIGKEESHTDALGRVTRYEYDDIGRRSRTTFPDGTTELDTYDAESRHIAHTDRAGRITTKTYDAVGHELSVAYPDGAVTRHSYDAAGRRLTTTDALGHTTTEAFDDAARRLSTTDAAGGVTTYSHDSVGNLATLRDPRGNTTSFQYDGLNRRTRITYADGTTALTAYDVKGRVASETDPAGRTTSFTYDCLDRLASVTDATGGVTTYAYDEVGSRTRQTDASGHVTRFEYDRLQRVTRRVLPLGDAAAFSYDAAGQLASRTDEQGRATTYAYDTVGRLLERRYPDATQVRFSYTPTGQRATAVDARGTTSYAYDARDRLVALTTPSGDGLSYTWDADGRRASITARVGLATRTTSYTHDAAHRLARVTDSMGRNYSATRDAAGNRTSLTYPNGVTTATSFDALNRLTALTSSSMAGPLQSYNYTIGPAGHRTSVTELDGTQRSFGRDARHRLTRERVTDGVGALVRQDDYTYDAVGNRLSRTRDSGGGPVLDVYGYDARDRLQSENALVYTSDGNGNRLSRSGADGATYTWDFDDRLVEVRRPDGTVIEDTYDADGLRVRTRINPPVGPPHITHYLVDPSDPLTHDLAQVIAESDDNGNLVATYVRGEELLGVIRGAALKTYHADGLGSIRLLADSAGAVTDTYDYSAFGEVLSHVGADPNPYQFAGEPYERESGLYYNRARWLDPRVGAFTSVDPEPGLLDTPATQHRYLYALDNPVDLTDPTGRFCFSIAGISISIGIQGNLRTTSAVSSLGVLRSVHTQLARLALQSVRALKAIRFRFPGQQIHHVIEQRLWNANPVLRQIFQHADDIPGVPLTPAQHQVFTNAWRAAFPYANQVGHIAKPTLEAIVEAASKIYVGHPAILRSIFAALL